MTGTHQDLFRSAACSGALSYKISLKSVISQFKMHHACAIIWLQYHASLSHFRSRRVVKIGLLKLSRSVYSLKFITDGPGSLYICTDVFEIAGSILSFCSAVIWSCVDFLQPLSLSNGELPQNYNHSSEVTYER
jgi:hypothetical protein